MPPITITQINSLLGGHGLHRDYISWKEIPSNVKLAAIASEDQLFLDHNGFDWVALQKSLQSSGKKRVKGAAASTISQQTAKNIFLWQGEGIMKYIRKGPEFYYTKLIEWVWGKQRILEVYLNTIEMGPGIFGIQAAAQKFYHKNAIDLTRSEAARIIACLPNPKKFLVNDPGKFVLWKTKWIIRQMNNIQSDKELSNFIHN